MRKLFILLFCFLILQTAFSAEITLTSSPVIGGQVVIEKGQTRDEIDSFFAILKRQNMNFCRIRMFESYMRDAQGNWDFSTFDMAFEAAEKYDITIIGTLFPMVEFTNIGGFKFPDSQEHLQSVAEYIKQMATHFKKFKSLYGWVLLNEIGSGKAPFSKPLTIQKFADWNKENASSGFNAAGNPIMKFESERFLLDYNTWYLEWLAKEVRKYDSTAHLHVNTHAIFDNFSEYAFPKWRKTLDSFGGSAHASWHFSKFSRNKFHYAMAANCQIMRSGAGEKPWILTEIQGGNNIWSGGKPMCPTKEEIEQWMWTIIGSGSKGMIFWSLNVRTGGIEAAEWGMLNLLNQPTDRLVTAGKVAGVLKNRQDIFSTATEHESGVSILYTRESFWCEQNGLTPGASYAGRLPGGGMQSAIGFFETLSQMGIQTNLKCIDEYNFGAKSNKGKVIIIPHQIALPTNFIEPLKQFVATGGTLLIEGLTAFFDENMHNLTNLKFPLNKLFGGLLKDVPLVDNKFNIIPSGQKSVLPAHLWEGRIQLETAKPLAVNSLGDVVASTNNFGEGKVIWIPSLVGVGAREANNYAPLSEFVSREVVNQLPTNTPRFKNFSEGVLMKVLNTKTGYVVVLINKNKLVKSVELIMPNAKPVSVLNKQSDNKVLSNIYMLQPEETKVIEYRN
ncbi:MAG: hypothetical protein GZ091_03075 [Paludibacter sp.]|nr:hypothetical protein [Paludibacter sp.]